jgi:hypothetical protein
VLIENEVMLIPILAVVLGLGSVIIAILARHRSHVIEVEHRHKERMAAIDKGLELPPEPAPKQEYANRRPSGGSRILLRGLIWLGVGIALVVPGNRFDRDFWSFGWIAVAIGAAYLIYYLVEGRHIDPPNSPGSSTGGNDQPRNGPPP